MKLPNKQSGDDMAAMDALMSSSDDKDAANEGAEAVTEPRGDPAELVASIQAQLDELSQLLAG